MPPLERARLVAERLGALADPPRPIGQGTAHHAFAVGPFVIRLVDDPELSTASGLAREAALLDRLQTRLPVAVPHPTLVAPDLGAMVYRALPGRALLDVRLRDQSRLVDDIAALLTATVNLDAEVLGDLVAPDPYPLGIWRDEVVEDVLAHDHELTTIEVAYIRAFARTPLPPPPTCEVFCHNDLGAEHLLVDETSGHLIGVIDWSDAALTDPCRDLGRLTRDLGARAVDLIIAQADFDPAALDRRRVAFHARVAALEDLSHGITSGDRRYLESARKSVGELFGSVT
jgi:aminoglycoside phosphotransferase (APT) family kinase protein